MTANRIFAGALVAFAALAPQIAAAVEVETQGDATLETMGVLALGAEEIGVAAGDFRVHRLTLASGAVATVANAAGEASVVFVERGVVARDGDAFHAGRSAALTGETTVTLRNEASAPAVLLISDVVGVAQ